MLANGVASCYNGYRYLSKDKTTKDDIALGCVFFALGVALVVVTYMGF